MHEATIIEDLRRHADLMFGMVPCMHFIKLHAMHGHQELIEFANERKINNIKIIFKKKN